MSTYCYKVTQSLYIKDIYILHLNDRVCKRIPQPNPESVWFYFTHKDKPYSLRKRSYSWLTKNSFILL